MITTRQMNMIVSMPKAENHIHIEGSIPWGLAIEISIRNKVNLPCDNVDDLRNWVLKIKTEYGLNGFMYCNRIINSVCKNELDYLEVILALAKSAREQNIIYQELHLDYPLNEERGIPVEVVMEGYRAGKKVAKEQYGVDMIYIAGLDRTRSSAQCEDNILKMGKYLDIVKGIGMDCEEIGHPCKKHMASYRLADEMGLFKTAHAGEDKAVENGSQNIWDAIQLLGVQRIDHGLKAAGDQRLMDYLRERQMLCTICPTANVVSGNAKGYMEHPVRVFREYGIPCSINSDDPPYGGDLVQEYARALDRMAFTEDALIQMARNAFEYSICGRKYLAQFDAWHKKWCAGEIKSGRTFT